MVLDEEIRKLKFDTRLIDWNLKQGIFRQSDLDQYLKTLPDTAQNSEPISLANLDADDGRDFGN